MCSIWTEHKPFLINTFTEYTEATLTNEAPDNLPFIKKQATEQNRNNRVPLLNPTAAANITNIIG